MNRQSQHQQQQDEEEDEANLSPSQLLQLAETHLRLRNFSLCRQYALESQQPNDPNSLSNHRHASQLLAISNILSSPTNYYSILQVDTFSNDITLIRSKFKHLLSILDPIKDKSNLTKEAVNLVWKAYDCLSDPTKKTHFDAQISGQNSGFDEMGSFWTFCPYCFYMFQYARVYEGCCLRCQNEDCRRAFHGVAVNSLPKAELDKGKYFSCFGYFPLGFNPNEEQSGKKGSKFESWTPIVGMFPVTKLGKNVGDDTNFIEIVDESDESENDQVGGKGENFGSNVEGTNAGNPRPKRRKSVAWSARKLMGKGRRDDNEGGVDDSGDYEDEDVDEEYGFEGDQGGVGDVSGFGAEDMAFFEEGGEIFVEFGPDGGAL